MKFSDSKYKQKRFKGICEKTFKKRYADHKKSLNLVKSNNDLIYRIWVFKAKIASPRTDMGNQKIV